MLDLLDAFIEYLIVPPARVERLRTRPEESPGN
jgi:hypothetical protein